MIDFLLKRWNCLRDFERAPSLQTNWLTLKCAACHGIAKEARNANVNPKTTGRKEARMPDWQEKKYFFNEWVKVTNFYLRLGSTFLSSRLPSTIPFITEIWAPCESPLCREPDAAFINSFLTKFTREVRFLVDDYSCARNLIYRAIDNFYA